MKNKTLRVIKLFEFYVQFIWPVHRRLVASKFAKRCGRCAASEKMSPLNSEGICQLCLGQKSKHPSQRQIQNEVLVEKFNATLSQASAGKNRNYDALVLFSGGKDSTYMIHRIRQEHPNLRLLAYTIDNGFMSPIAIENVNEMVVKMDLDHIFVKPPKKFYVQLFRYALTHLNAEGSYGTVDFSDGEFMLDTARKIAAEKKIPIILCGYSRYQVQNGLKLDDYKSPPSAEARDRTEVAGLKLNQIFDSVDLARWWRNSEWDSNERAQLVFPLYAWDLEEEEIKAKVREWGLLRSKEYSPAATNHQLIPLLGVVDVHQFGFSSFEYEFCRMIREGKADLHHWQMTFEFLEYTARTGLFLKPTVLELLSQLDLTCEEVGIQFGKEYQQ
jgi:tRNA(Ile)-lysidine synthase TilS/MesJ